MNSCNYPIYYELLLILIQHDFVVGLHHTVLPAIRLFLAVVIVPLSLALQPKTRTLSKKLFSDSLIHDSFLASTATRARRTTLSY